MSGSVTADAALAGGVATVSLEAQHAGIPGSSVSRAVLKARVTDPAAHPVVAATLEADGIEAGGLGGSAKLAVNGPEDALALRLSAALTGVAGAEATVASAATLNVPGKSVQLASLTADWKGQVVRLLAPARVGFGDGVAVDRLRIGLQQAVLDLAGRVTPTLALTATLRGVTPDLAKPFAPSVDAAGEIGADARLTGTVAAPSGTVRLTATGLRMRTGPARSLPPANVTASVQLAGKSASVDARLVAGRSTLAVTGRAPLGAGALALRATGGVDLAMLDPILLAEGRRARGQVALDAGVTGTLAAPQVNGTLTLADGEVQDFGQGVRIAAIAATIQATGRTIRIASFTGRAGAGTIGASGTVGLEGALPVNVTVTMRNARPLASDRLTADLDADLAVRGDVQGTLAASGKIAIRQATINIPEHLPTSIAVLPVRIAGQRPPPPSKPGAVIRLDLQLDTPGQIFVRGRGLDAVLGGSLHVGGTTAAPQVSGGFAMRRGTFNLAGTTLTFTRGKVGFDGAGVTDKIDPSLDFEADSPTTSGHRLADRGGLRQRAEDHPDGVPAATPGRGAGAAAVRPQRLPARAVPIRVDRGGAGGVVRHRQRVQSAGPGAKGAGAGPVVRGGWVLPGGSSSNSAATIEAGKYIANGVYVGAKQGTSGAQTQATGADRHLQGPEGGDGCRHGVGGDERRVELPVRVLSPMSARLPLGRLAGQGKTTPGRSSDDEPRSPRVLEGCAGSPVGSMERHLQQSCAAGVAAAGPSALPHVSREVVVVAAGGHEGGLRQAANQGHAE